MSTSIRSGVRAEYLRPKDDSVYSALYKLEVTLHPENGHPKNVTLELRFRELNQTFRKDLALTGEPITFWLAINTHLLPNGLNHIDVLLTDSDDGCFHSDCLAITILNEGPLAERVRRSLTEDSAPLVFDGKVDSECFDIHEPSLVPWYERADALDRVEQMLRRGEISADDGRDLRALIKNGWVQLANKIDPEMIAAANAAVDDAVAKKYQGYEYGTSQRIQHLHDHYDAIRQLWKHPIVLRFLRLVFEVEALPCQTLTYLFGSQQDLHQDTIHLTAFPSGYMCGVWIALEDIRSDSGELMVVSGSHRLDRIYRQTVGCDVVQNDDWQEFGKKVVSKWQDMYRESGLSIETYRPAAGSILVWLDSLLHGGSKRNDMSLTRRSIVSHYFASGSLAYYDSTGLPGYTIR